MAAYREAVSRAPRYPLIAQIDDDVVCVSRGHRAARRPAVRAVSRGAATGGGRVAGRTHDRRAAADGTLPAFDADEGSVHRADRRLVCDLPPLGPAAAARCPNGAVFPSRCRYRAAAGTPRATRRARLRHEGLSRHRAGYAAAFGMLEFEIAKYRRLNRLDVVGWYESYSTEIATEDSGRRIAAIEHRSVRSLATEGFEPQRVREPLPVLGPAPLATDPSI